MDIDQILANVEKDIADAEARVTELHQIRQGLTYAKERYGDIGVAARPSVLNMQPIDEWHLLATKDVVIMALRELGAPAETRQVHEALAAHGRDERYEAVRASLNYSKRKGDVVSLRPGLWAIATERADNDPGPAVKAGPEEATEDAEPTPGNVFAGAFGTAQPVR